MKQFIFALSLFSLGCQPACSTIQKENARAYLDGVVKRVDAATLIGCAGSLPDYRAVGSCLAGFALNTVTGELRRAIDGALARVDPSEGPRASVADQRAALDALSLQLAATVAAQSL